MEKQTKIVFTGITIIVVVIVVVVLILSIIGIRGVVPISEINQHPNRYINTEVTVKARYYMPIGDLYLITDESGLNMLSAKIMSGVDDSIIIQGGFYYWTGTITQQDSGIRLDVTDIQSV